MQSRLGNSRYRRENGTAPFGTRDESRPFSGLPDATGQAVGAITSTGSGLTSAITAAAAKSETRQGPGRHTPAILSHWLPPGHGRLATPQTENGVGQCHDRGDIH
jgi:hypothetical protein